MRNKKTFDMLGVSYRCQQFSAEKGMGILGREGLIHPCEVLSGTEVEISRRIWISLDSRQSINSNVKDLANVLAPRLVLEGLLSVVNEFNFGFLAAWKNTKIPSRFIEESNSISSKYTEPILSQLIQDEVASMRELQEYYSLEDAFKMFDIVMVKGINQALSNESSMKNAKRR